MCPWGADGLPQLTPPLEVSKAMYFLGCVAKEMLVTCTVGYPEVLSCMFARRMWSYSILCCIASLHIEEDAVVVLQVLELLRTLGSS